LAESTALNATPRGPFFDVARIIRAKQPAIFVLENVKNLKSHDKGNTFRIIMNALDELGYDVADSDAHGAKDPKIIDGKNFRPQHRERIVLVGFRRDLKLNDGFSLSGVSALYPSRRPTLRSCWTLRSIAVTSFLQSSGNTFITTLKSTRQKAMDLAMVW
jgi:DNA-cytosine methyltransferase